MHHHHHHHAPGCTDGRIAFGRRTALLGLGALLAMGRSTAAFAAGATSPARLVVINVRGGLDGLSLVAPYGDPYLAQLRKQIMAPLPGKPGGMFDLGGFYGLHPAMPHLYALYQAGQASMIHAVGNALSSRSHFIGQDYLQSGATEVLSNGWLNRVVSLMPANGAMQPGISLCSAMPLLVQGPATMAGWARGAFIPMKGNVAADVAAMLAADPLLGPAYSVGFADRAAFDADFAADAIPAKLTPLETLAYAAGDILAAPGGPAIAAIETDSFDTHADQVQRLDTGLGELDRTIRILQHTLGSAWTNTVVLTMTEFGRTAYANGAANCGTDHGTGFAMFLAGGAVKGGQVIATWPGLSPSQLYENRDLAPTLDFRSVAMGVLQDHLGLSDADLATVFPNAGVTPLGGLVKS